MRPQGTSCTIPGDQGWCLGSAGSRSALIQVKPWAQCGVFTGGGACVQGLGSKIVKGAEGASQKRLLRSSFCVAFGASLNARGKHICCGNLKTKPKRNMDGFLELTTSAPASGQWLLGTWLTRCPCPWRARMASQAAKYFRM